MVRDSLSVDTSYKADITLLLENYKEVQDQLVSRYGEGSDLRFILRRNGFQDEVGFLKRYKVDNSQINKDQIAILNPIFYLLKLKYEGFS